MAGEEIPDVYKITKLEDPSQGVVTIHFPNAWYVMSGDNKKSHVFIYVFDAHNGIQKKTVNGFVRFNLSAMV